MKRFSVAVLVLVMSLAGCAPSGDDRGEQETNAAVSSGVDLDSKKTDYTGTDSTGTDGTETESTGAESTGAENTETESGDISTAVNRLGIDLFHRLRGDSDDNLIISPLSVALALGMVLPGTDSSGDAARELLQLLGADTTDTVNRGLGALQSAMTRYNDTDGITLAIANRGFVQHDYPLRPQYLDQLDEWYGVAAESVDYGEPDTARHTINRWVAAQTNDLITELLPPGSVTADARLTLVNAIYLLADWRYPFDKAQTSDQPFHLADGSVEPLPTMRATITVPVIATDEYRAVELPYKGDQLAMMIIVPEELSAFQDSLDSARLDAIAAALQPERVELWLPRAETRFNGSLVAPLQSLGVRDVFCVSCNPLPGISTEGGMVVTDVVHETYLRMDETGTEAAAATGAVISVTSMPLPPTQLRVDRPYFLALRDRDSGTILFLGRMMDPR